jgi:citrate synthase
MHACTQTNPQKTTNQPQPKQATLPAAKEGGEPLPEGLLWLLLTGDVPTKAQAASVTEELRARSKLPPHVLKVLNALPDDTHPMTQFCSLILALQVWFLVF